jgi:S-adenosylmethionine:tRNA ribosyltransferase-isomerase
MRTDEFDFVLPTHLIAQYPPDRRGASRLLRVRGCELEDRVFADLPGFVQEHDLLVFNDTRVLKARLSGIKESGGKVEVMVERLLNDHQVLAQIRASKPPGTNSRLLLANKLSVIVLGRQGEFYQLHFDSNEKVITLLEEFGQLPLPPYITHIADTADEERYQTVYARHLGAVAAPTAGLHFDDTMLKTLGSRGARIAYVTLHVGAGTFQPVRVTHTHQHVMHSERYAIPQVTLDAICEARARGGRVIAVGTTSLRALESIASDAGIQGGQGKLKSGDGETRIFITPGYHFKIVDMLLTNFHLPKSTLLMLVCAFGGMSELLAAYRHAVEQEYRFFSYGDAMLIERDTP